MIKTILNILRKIFFWVLAVFFAFLSLAYITKPGGVLLLLASVLLMPIDRMQNALLSFIGSLFQKVKNPKKVKALFTSIIFIIGFVLCVSYTEPAPPKTPDLETPSIAEQQQDPTLDLGENAPLLPEPSTPSLEEVPSNEDSDQIESPSEPSSDFNPNTTPEPSPDESNPSEPGISDVVIPPEATEQPTTTAPETPIDSTFEIHFIDVGQGDAALILCDGHSMLIDGGKNKNSSLIYSYLKKLDLTELDYMVASHGHEDHVGGLAGALNFATVDTVYCPVTDHDSEPFRDFLKYLDKQGKSITVPKAGDEFYLGSAKVQILSADSSASDHNNTSIVMRIVYGETSFIFTGDAERETEQLILSKDYDLESTVLKVGHHGSENSTTYPFLRAIMPLYAVIPVGEGNGYGHPTDGALSRLRDADVKVYRTDLHGDIICTSNGQSVSFETEKTASKEDIFKDGSVVVTPPVVTPTPAPSQSSEPDPVEPDPVGTDYVLNTNTKKFHYTYCRSVKQMKDKNKAYYTGNRDDVINMGYDPCGNCHP